VSLGVLVRIGVTFGRAWCGIMGSGDRHEYTFLGDDVNLAARLMCNAKPNSILVNSVIWSKCNKHYLNFDKPPKIKVKGKNDWIEIYEPKNILDPKIAKEGKENEWLQQMMLPWEVRDSTYGGMSPLCSLTTYPLAEKLRRLLQLQVPTPGAIVDANAALMFLGNRGMGKVTLMEHTLGELVLKQGLTPVYSFSVALNHKGPLHALKDLVHELCDLDPDGATSGHVVKMANNHLQRVLPTLDVDTFREFKTSSATAELDAGVIAGLVERVLCFVEQFCEECTDKGLVVVLRAQKGTAMYEHCWEDVFWKMVVSAVNLTKERRKRKTAKSLVFLIVGRDLDKLTEIEGLESTVNWIMESDWMFKTEMLTKECITEYILTFMNVSSQVEVSKDLMDFVEEYAEGNPRNLSELLVKLKNCNNILVMMDTDGSGKGTVSGVALNTLDVSSWEDTTLVSDMQTTIERLRPDILKVLKVACELQDFEPADIMHVLVGYSTKAVRNLMDDVIVFKACTELVQMGIFEQIHEIESRYRLHKGALLKSCVQKLLLHQQRLLINRRTLLRKLNSTVAASFNKKIAGAAFIQTPGSTMSTASPPASPIS